MPRVAAVLLFKDDHNEWPRLLQQSVCQDSVIPPYMCQGCPPTCAVSPIAIIILHACTCTVSTRIVHTPYMLLITVCFGGFAHFGPEALHSYPFQWFFVCSQDKASLKPIKEADKHKHHNLSNPTAANGLSGESWSNWRRPCLLFRHGDPLVQLDAYVV